MRILVVFALSVPLAGCFSLTAPKPIPEWAMQPQASAVEPAARPQRAAVVRRRAPPIERQVADQTGTVVGAPTYVQPAGLSHTVVRNKPTALTTRDVTAFSAEWHAREDARDADL